MMHNFLTNNRAELIARCRAKVAQRPKRKATARQLQEGIPTFLDQLIRTLRIEQSADPADSRKVSGPSDGSLALSEVGESAALHGRNLLELGFSVDQVVHDYGDLCQAITDLAYERDAPFLVDEFRTLNRCLDNAIADAVTEFSYQRDIVVVSEKIVEMNERLGFFSHELRNFLGTATLAFAAVKAGNLGLSGATGYVLEQSLEALTKLVDQALGDVRDTAEHSLESSPFSLSELIEDIKRSAELAASLSGCVFSVSRVDLQLGVRGDRHMLYSAIMNLLQNAFKFTKMHTEVTLNAYSESDRIVIDVIDHCGGLPVGSAERMFLPFVQNGGDKSGLGLGLPIARRGVESMGGELKVRDEEGKGCVFTISLPRYAVTIN